LLLLCGGGAKNRFLYERIVALLPDCEVAATDDYGVSGDYMEAMAFAWLAYKRVHREPVELMTVTGARENGILGGLYA
jgi:anhydro-N-acetylmuramic acid kinase